MSSNDNPSTLKSYVDSAAGAVQSGIASLTGNTSDKAQAEQTRAHASAEHAASESAVKVGPLTLGSSGDRSRGAWDQTVGSGKETVGNLVGSEGLKREGREQNLQGQGQEAKGQLADFGQGVGDRVAGTMGGAVAALVGDRDEQRRWQERHDEGKTRQRGAEVDMDKAAS
ncbi:hypothetical protein EPUS_02682 [Endocarpon pusillum Z07020]|uniref:CsbD-like domain-containing protein n=1 Tax=Endocarpon pusillum (strain Z07020 / HMAS-L-300199) TaxID=1263415 RepID=U1I4D1_ENDPU|nr:uncharacterized protein EPUS_02682 [Endocarpon pusillum Z07020]ERF76969.1 hypothetical protein EPUS_02682 [Endocarpon pusillum Z07020]